MKTELRYYNTIILMSYDTGITVTHRAYTDTISGVFKRIEVDGTEPVLVMGVYPHTSANISYYLRDIMMIIEKAHT